MKQIDQDPGDYRVQASDGSWQTRLNKPMCRVLAIMGAVFLAWLGISFVGEGGSPAIPFVFGFGGLLVGAAITLSLKSINW